MRFIPEQNNITFLQVRKQYGVFTFFINIIMQFLNCRKFYLYIITEIRKHINFSKYNLREGVVPRAELAAVLGPSAADGGAEEGAGA